MATHIITGEGMRIHLEACIARAGPVLLLAAAACEGAAAVVGLLLPAVHMLLQQGLPCIAVILRALLRIMVLVLLALCCADPGNHTNIIGQAVLLLRPAGPSSACISRVSRPRTYTRQLAGIGIFDAWK